MRRPGPLLIALLALGLAAPAAAVTPAPTSQRASAGPAADDIFMPRKKTRTARRDSRHGGLGRGDSRNARAYRIEKTLRREGCDDAYEKAVESGDGVQVNQVIARCSRKR